MSFEVNSMSEILDKIVAEIAETDISAHDFKVVNEIIEKYKHIG